MFLSAVLAATCTLAQPPRAAVTYDPNDPENTREVVAREARERLGLKPHTWAGVIHPDAYARLEKLTRTEASLKQRLRDGDEDAFDKLWAMRFRGKVYVQVLLKSRDAQRRVLASLKASEFQAWQLLAMAPGIVGFASKAGLDKLARNPDVTAVSLDDGPLPEGPTKMVFKNQVPASSPEDTFAEEPGVKDLRVDPAVYRAFRLTDRVYVSVALRTECLPELTDRPSEMALRNELRDEAERRLRLSVLDSLNGDDFFTRVEEGFGAGLLGFVTREGLRKLIEHPQVLRIDLDEIKQHP